MVVVCARGSVWPGGRARVGGGCTPAGRSTGRGRCPGGKNAGIIFLYPPPVEERSSSQGENSSNFVISDRQVRVLAHRHRTAPTFCTGPANSQTSLFDELPANSQTSLRRTLLLQVVAAAHNQSPESPPINEPHQRKNAGPKSFFWKSFLRRRPPSLYWLA